MKITIIKLLMAWTYNWTVVIVKLFFWFIFVVVILQVLHDQFIHILLK
ncbi:MAG: hypothetical protein K9H62_23065 [Bacteroidales bacterium]|nr:hypothetical protein [Bacteroidales bacterium]